MILITGANGFVGSAILEELLTAGHEVVAMHRSKMDTSAYPESQCRFIRVDLTAGFTIPIGIETVIHTAGASPLYSPSVNGYIRNNVMATSNLAIEATRAGVKNFINLSSLSVYGDIQSSVIDETTNTVTSSPYGMSKRLGELLLMEMKGAIKSVSIRLPGIIGYGATNRPWLMKVHQQLRNNDPVAVTNAAHVFNSAVHISDISRWIGSLATLDLPGAGIITAAGKDPMTFRQAVDLLRDLSESTSVVTYRDSPYRHVLVNNDLAISDYGYEPASVEQTIRRMAEERHDG